MADFDDDSDYNEYAIAEQELQDHVLDIYGSKENEMDLFRPALADQNKVGFFSLDRGSQTDVTEIVDLKEMTEVLQILLQDVANLKRDINFSKHVMQADYESKLKEKSLELYNRINERVGELEKMHEERVGTVRRAFRQQLSDAIARVGVLYDKNMESRLQRHRKKQAGEQGKLDEKYREMQNTIQRNEQVIQMLKAQLSQYQKRSPSIDESSDVSQSPTRSYVATPQAPTPQIPAPIDEESLKSPTPQINHEAEELKEEMSQVQKKCERLEEALEIKEEQTSQLASEVEKLQQEMEKQRILNEQLRYENEEVKASSEQDKQSQKRMAEDMLDRQRQDMERQLNERMKQAKEEALSAAQQDAKNLQDNVQAKVKQLLDQKKALEEQLMKERAKNANKSEDEMNFEKMKKNEEKLKEEIVRLKKEIERIHRTWEKKFAILQQSLHALKDESYLRQTLQRQAAALHHASVSYAVDAPKGIIPSKPGTPTKRPLPEITKSGKSAEGHGGPRGDKDYISYTVSAPSGRGTAMFSLDENQVMSGDEADLPVDVIPLPDPPRRKSQQCVEESRPDSKSPHVVIVPSIQAQ